MLNALDSTGYMKTTRVQVLGPPNFFYLAWTHRSMWLSLNDMSPHCEYEYIIQMQYHKMSGVHSVPAIGQRVVDN